MELTDKGLVDLLKDGNEDAFQKVFTTYYAPLHAYAFTIITDEIMANEIVQNVFFKIWNRKEKLKIQFSLKAYLYKAIHNECMDHLKNKKYENVYKSHLLSDNKNLASGEDVTLRMEMTELEKKLQKALNELPNKCRTIFQLSRFEGLKYQEIAVHLGLSVKTVEAQMGKALKRLRVSLAEFLTLLIFILWIH